MLYSPFPLTGNTKWSGYIITFKTESITPFLKTHMDIYTTAYPLPTVPLFQDLFDFASHFRITLKVSQMAPTYFDPIDGLGS